MTNGGNAPSTAAGGAPIIRSGSQRWSLPVGVDLTFGRGDEQDIRFGHDPEDDLVSRRTGVLSGDRDGVLIRNVSHTQAFRLIAMPGPEFTIRPGMVLGSMPFAQTRLEVLGRYGRHYSLHIDTSALVLPDGPDPRGRGTTRYEPDRLTPRELRLLAALCEPLLTLAGAPPATYREIAERLGETATVNSVRTGLDRLRHRLAHDNGIPGLRTEDDEASVRDSAHYVAELARWAVDTHQIDGQTIHLVLAPRPSHS